ncbi:MAG: MerR family transcriptional regulator [Lachnospiraceae bacterium]|jgi:DNA-binding transcriptional MerR regulator|nr:MerR family transcriptional regulator [Lachnospiraceae bacterium]
MTIKETEKRTGLSRSNIRFYEKEKLIVPSRNEKNGYRDYSEKDVEDIKKIAYLRTIRVSVEDIRNVIEKKITLYEVIEKQSKALEGQITDLNRAKAMCEKMLATENISYEELEVKQYIVGSQDYWKDNQQTLKLDSVHFLYLWGSFLTWTVITVLCLGIGIVSYAKLPANIPVQWSNGVAISLVNKNFIFAYPIVCVIIRYLLRTCIYARLQINNFYSEIITEYLINYMCFLALSIEIFTILFVYDLVKNIVVILFIDTIVLMVLLFAGIRKRNLRGKEKL